MSFEYIIEKDNSVKKLTEDEENKLVKQISSTFASLNSQRAANLEMASNLANEIFFKNDFKSLRDKNQKWKAKVKMCKTFMFYQTLKAFIWRNTYANVNSMFDVSGENRDANNMSNKQKAMLVDIFEKMDFQKTCDKVIDNALLFGELISFTAWKKNYEEYRRPIEFFQNIFSQDFIKLPKIMEAIKQGKNYWVDTKKIYDNPYVYPVNPSDLVFDTAQVDNWDNCPKIYRSFKTPSDIINNQYYDLNDEQKEIIVSLVNNSDSNRVRSDYNTRVVNEDVVNGSTIEVLEHWGDLKLPNGKILKNWHAVIVGRKFLVEFGKNERIINPFSYGAFITDPETKRGISPLYCVLSLALFQEDLLNRTCNLQSLNENPPLLAPEGFFDEDEIELYPGKIIEYGDNLSPTAAFQQMSFNPTVFLQDISFLNDLMAEVSGIFPNMVGAVESTGAKTATEINTKSQGQMTRLSMLVDTINQDFILPNVEKVAKLCADFKSGVETVFLNKENQPENIEIDDEVRQAEYKYTYSDSSNSTLKSEQADMLVVAVEKFAQKLSLNLEEIFLWYFEQKGVDNPERFLAQQVQSGGIELPQFPQIIEGDESQRLL
ncbi:MAG: hypothetical protein NC408_07855 [Candidatus Gastranaerophilales bacterium]|nr:hypothetical protein [Candidatus Gastranaerophilales bacterium]MCM1072591.1 hypothetical protein [Bacteroides sp.]